MSTLSFSSLCPHCGQRAPIVLRGLEPRCTACGRGRLPLSAANLSLAGQPSRIGGTAAAVVGWAILIIGVSFAVAITLLLQSIWPAAFIGWAVGLPVAAISLFFGLLFVLGGRGLRRRGNERQREVQLEAVRALLAHRGGSSTAREAAQALQLSEEEADALLTRIASEPSENVAVEVDDDGQLRYVFGGTEKRWRVLEEQAARVGTQGTRATEVGEAGAEEELTSDGSATGKGRANR